MAAAWLAGARGFSAGNVATLDSAAFTISGSDKYLRVLVYSGAGTPATPTGVKWDAAGANQSLTQIETAITFQTNFRASVWALVAPADGTSKVVTVTWPSNQDETMVIADAYTGVDQSTPTRTLPTPAQGSGASSGTLAVTSVADDLVVGSTTVGGSGSLTTMSSSQVTIREKVEGNDIGGFECCCQGDITAAGTSTTVGAQWAGGTGAYVVFGAALIPSSGGGGGAAPETESRTNKRRRPGRGPYSKGAYKRPHIDVLPQTYWTVDTDAVAATDSASANAAFSAAATDSVAAGDSADRSGDVLSLAADAVNATDSADATGVFVTDAADAVAAIDAATSDQKPIISDRTGTQANRPGRTPYSVGRYFRPRLDVFSNSIALAATDAVAASDSASTTIVGVAAAADAVAASDSASQAGVFAANASDSVSISDIAASTLAGDREATDAANTIDTADAIIVGTAFASEALALGDSADSSLFGNVLFAVETFGPSDAANTAGSVYVGTAAEAQTLADLASAVKIGLFEPTHDSRDHIHQHAPRVRKGRVGGRRI
jgi:hypothetical protein